MTHDSRVERSDATQPLVVPVASGSLLTVWLERVTRWALGGLLIVSVVVRVIQPADGAGFESAAQAWLTAMDETGYLRPLLLATELAVGLALISRRFVPLALIVFAPINLNIFLLHVLLDPQPVRLVQVALMAAAHVGLAWRWRAAYAPLFAPYPTAGWRNAVRLALGLLFVGTGGAKLLGVAGADSELVRAMQATGYLYLVLGGVEVLGGALLVSGRWLALGLVLLAPVMANILAYHAFLDPFTPFTLVSLGAAAGLAALAWSARAAWVGALRS